MKPAACLHPASPRRAGILPRCLWVQSNSRDTTALKRKSRTVLVQPFRISLLCDRQTHAIFGKHFRSFRVACRFRMRALVTGRLGRTLTSDWTRLTGFQWGRCFRIFQATAFRSQCNHRKSNFWSGGLFMPTGNGRQGSASKCAHLSSGVSESS